LAGNQTHSIEYAFEGTTLRETIENEWVYGPGGQLKKVIEAGEKVTQYLYDQAGRLKTVIKPDEAKIHRTYDDLGRLSHFYGDKIDYRYIYDLKDRLIEVDDKILNTTTHRVYDIYDNLIEEKLASGLTLLSDYDPYGKRTALYLPDGSEVTYTYQGPYLHSLSRNGFTHTYSERNLSGKPTQISLPNHLGTLSITWDSCLRLKQFNSPHYKAQYTYDSVGNLTECAYIDPLGADANTYSYDDLNQLTSENEHDYLYDSLYNRTGKDEAQYSLNSLCQVTDDDQKEYEYDTNGNLISDGECTYEYDLLDRLIAVNTSNNRITYTYDAFNRRIAKNNELYLWDDKNEIGMSLAGQVRELRILGEGLGAEIGAAVIYEIDGESYFPIHDVQGSLAMLVDATGKPNNTYRYTPFGEQLTEDNHSPWRFASKRYDEETGFIYFGRRYYSPALGRWITADPQGFDDGPNLYAYVHNCPMTGYDLYGLLSMREGISNIRHFAWGAVEGLGYYAYSMSELCGMKDCSVTPWQPRSLLSKPVPPVGAKDWIEQATLPFTYEARRTDDTVPQTDVMRARGRTCSEQFITIGGALGIWNAGKSALQSGVKLQNAIRLSIPQKLSREYLFSGKVKLPKGVGGEVIGQNTHLKIVEIEKQISKWLGSGSRFIKNKAGDSIFISKEGTKRVRFDFNNPTPHTNPHAHIEIKIDNKWHKSGPIYPVDVPPR